MLLINPHLTFFSAVVEVPMLLLVICVLDDIRVSRGRQYDIRGQE